MPPTFLKILQGAGVFTFLGVRGGKKDGTIKFEDAFWRSLGVFWSLFGGFFMFFGAVHA